MANDSIKVNEIVEKITINDYGRTISQLNFTNVNNKVTITHYDDVTSQSQVSTTANPNLVVNVLPYQGNITVQEADRVSVVTVGQQGPRGVSGTSAEGSYSFERVSYVVEDTSETIYNLPRLPRENTLKIFLNGILERPVTPSGSVVDLSFLELGVGDEVTFDYMYGA